MNHFRPTGFKHRWRSIDQVTVSLSDGTDKQTSWLINVTFHLRQVMTMAVQRYGRSRCLITFLRRVICTINTESSQLIHRNDLKIKCKIKSLNLIFLTFIGWWSQWSSLKFYKKRMALHGILAPLTAFITRWTSKNQTLILKYWNPNT